MSFVAQPYHISNPGYQVLEELRSEFEDDHNNHPEFETEADLSGLSEQDIEVIEQELYEAITNDIAEYHGQNVSIEEFEVKIDKENSLITVTKNKFMVIEPDNHDEEY